MEVTIALFTKLFTAFGITRGLDVFATKDFDNAIVFRFQAFTLCVYLYLDTTDGFQKRAFQTANNKFDAFNKGYLIGKTESLAKGVIAGRA